ncbi:hypothetical protein AZE42_01698 [Rhizopogon vesiculosus]|uniref:Uncharacterized protein n=1 Tax=Rhizopogon vesiculosus TaxID=180088 RepID=A0A1J8QFJ7_9AGAM|nr:hypothetical protein AZE42_01698 [Rhizopogon vesiculosus]
MKIVVPSISGISGEQSSQVPQAGQYSTKNRRQLLLARIEILSRRLKITGIASFPLPHFQTVRE